LAKLKKVSIFVFYLLLFVFPLGQLLRWQPSGLSGARFHPLDFLIFIFVIAWFLRKILKKKSFSPPLFSKEMVAFGLMAAVSLFLKKVGRLKTDEFLISFFYLLRLGNFIAFYWALSDFFTEQFVPVLKYLVWEGLAVASIAFFQYIFFPDMRILLYLGWDEHYFRAIGSFLDPAFTFLLFVFAFFSLTVYFFNNKEKKIYLYGAGFFLIFLIGLTFSRIAYLTLLAGLLTIVYFRKKVKFYFLFLPLFLGLILFLPKPGGEGVNLLRKSSLIAKLDNVKQSWQIIRENFWFGVGFNAYRFAQKDFGFISPKNWQVSNSGGGADNSFLFVFATTGIFGFISFLYFWLKVFQRSLSGVNKKPFSLLLFLTWLTLTLSSFSVNFLFYPWAMFWLMIVLAKFNVEN